jgi:hypothetical protein
MMFLEEEVILLKGGLVVMVGHFHALVKQAMRKKFHMELSHVCSCAQMCYRPDTKQVSVNLRETSSGLFFGLNFPYASLLNQKRTVYQTRKTCRKSVPCMVRSQDRREAAMNT